MRLLIEGINPEPWRAGKLMTKVVARKAVPIQFKDQGTAAYQEAVHETVAGALAELGVPLPIYPKGTLLRVYFSFWRQIEQYTSLTTGRKVTPNQPDTSNMVKATEDALQGLLFFNDRDNRICQGNLVQVGPDVEPAIMIFVDKYEPQHAQAAHGEVIFLKDHGEWHKGVCVLP